MELAHVPALSLLVAAILIYVPRGFTFAAQAKQPEGFDNALPRAQQARLTGLGARAQGAHMNSFEAFAPFAAGVLSSQHAGAPIGWVVGLCATFLVARVVYLALYLGDRPTARSVVWGVGFLSALALLALPLLVPAQAS